MTAVALDDALRVAIEHGGAAADPEMQRLGYVELPAEGNPRAMFTFYERAMDDETCDRLIAAALQHPPQIIHRLDPVLGSSSPMELWFVRDLAGVGDISRQVSEIGNQANEAWWRYDIDEWDPGIIIRYRAGTPTAGLPWHQDGGLGGGTTKAAYSVQLSDGDDYVGGDMLLRMPSHIRPMPRSRGTVIVIPGPLVHCITPVTAGVRWSLAARAIGPPLR